MFLMDYSIPQGRYLALIVFLLYIVYSCINKYFLAFSFQYRGFWFSLFFATFTSYSITHFRLEMYRLDLSHLLFDIRAYIVISIVLSIALIILLSIFILPLKIYLKKQIPDTLKGQTLKLSIINYLVITLMIGAFLVGLGNIGEFGIILILSGLIG
ncbi:hypothetical protein CQA53_10960 [Helicobacter didelphidarum]|uniref:Uncharacterized protein n=1 Tax=Helicobacter didelphidarum TaxID=2040648 RepID=A0A3D8I5F1_9HELI|nr:hypothetical protein [Helicobacter didelphidarum]RDU60369.1 hypothetical protein CQA53_10960 [Helicobacter didelphidarum]